MRKTWIEWGIKRSRVVVGVLNYCRLNWIIVLAPALPGVQPSRILAHWGLLLGVCFEFALAAACVVCSCCLMGIRLSIWRYWLQDIILSQRWRVRILTQGELKLGVCFEFTLATACFNQGEKLKNVANFNGCFSRIKPGSFLLYIVKLYDLHILDSFSGTHMIHEHNGRHQFHLDIRHDWLAKSGNTFKISM